MRGRVTYANVASTLALVVALGGTGAYAAGLAKDSVTSAQIKNGAVKAVDLGKNSVTSKAVAKNSLEGEDIDESTLGKVPSAVTVDSVRHLTAAPAAGQTLPLLTKGALTVSAVCTAGGISKLQLKTSADHARWVTSNNQDEDFLVADGSADFGPISNGIAQVLVSAVTPTGVGLHVFGNTTADGAGHCRLDVVVTG
jgi:hypothetical protein